MDVNETYSGDELGFDLRQILAEGIVAAGHLAVTAGAGNSINIAAGHCYVLGDTNPDFQPCYGMFNDAVVNKGINPDPSNPRRVRVIAQIIDEAFAGTGRVWEIQALHGTPAGSPVLPAEPASAISLANILVPAAAGSSAAYTITDLRQRAFGLALSGGATDGQVPVWNAAAGRWEPGGGGAGELDYAEIAADTASITATTEGTAVAVVTGASVAYDGGRVKVEFWCPHLTTTSNGLVTFVLFRGAVVIGQAKYQLTTVADGKPVKVEAFDTPSAASHIYKVSAFVSAGNVTVKAGAGGSGNLLPAFLRVTKA